MDSLVHQASTLDNPILQNPDRRNSIVVPYTSGIENHYVPPSTKDEIMVCGYPSLEFIFDGYCYIYSTDINNSVSKWVSKCLTRDKMNKIYISRKYNPFNFYEDKVIDIVKRVTVADYDGSEYEKGHLAAARNHAYNSQAYERTFCLSIVGPMIENVNHIAKIKEQGRKLASKYGHIFSNTGPVYNPKSTLDNPILQNPDRRNSIVVPYTSGIENHYMPPSTKDEIMVCGYPSLEFIFDRYCYIYSTDIMYGVSRWASECLTCGQMENIHMSKKFNFFDFFEDEAFRFIMSIKVADYDGSGYEKGHLAAARNHAYNSQAYKRTFCLSNVGPMFAKVNHIIAKIEEQGRKLVLKCRHVFIITGPVYNPKSTLDNPIRIKSHDVPPSTKDEIMACGYPSLDFNLDGYGFIYSPDIMYGVSRWVSECLTCGQMENIYMSRKFNPFDFYEDEAVRFIMSIKVADYDGSGYEKGHLAAARNHAYNSQAYKRTFCLSNVGPMFPKVNHIIAKIEEQGRKFAKCGHVFIITGPVYNPKRKCTFLKENSEVVVPDGYFKVFAHEDTHKKQKIYRVFGYIVKNKPDDHKYIKRALKDINNVRRRLDSINKLTGLNILCGLDKSKIIEDAIPTQDEEIVDSEIEDFIEDEEIDESKIIEFIQSEDEEMDESKIKDFIQNEDEEMDENKIKDFSQNQGIRRGTGS